VETLWLVLVLLPRVRLLTVPIGAAKRNRSAGEGFAFLLLWLAVMAVAWGGWLLLLGYMVTEAPFAGQDLLVRRTVAALLFFVLPVLLGILGFVPLIALRRAGTKEPFTRARYARPLRGRGGKGGAEGEIPNSHSQKGN